MCGAADTLIAAMEKKCMYGKKGYLPAAGTIVGVFNFYFSLNPWKVLENSFQRCFCCCFVVQ